MANVFKEKSISMLSRKQCILYLLFIIAFFVVGVALYNFIIIPSKINYDTMSILIFHTFSYFIFGFVLGMPNLFKNLSKAGKLKVNKDVLFILWIPAFIYVILCYLVLFRFMNFVYLGLILIGYVTTQIFIKTDM
jgi:hypothetical protein